MYFEKMKDFAYPNDFIEEILLRLSVKSLIRFKSVCNSWNTLISDPRFAKSHFDSDLSPTTDAFLHLSKDGSEARLIDVNPTIHLPNCPSLRLPKFTRYARIVGSCRGFILVRSFEALTLWNPSTGLHEQIPLPAYELKLGNLWYGLGYDKFNDDYLVFMGCFAFYELKTKMGVFSLRTKSWKEIQGANLPYRIISGPDAGTFLNGSIHWIAEMYDLENNIKFETILAFDLMREKFVDISLPNKICGVFSNLMLLGGCLGVFYSEDSNYEFETWVMKEYGVKSSWTKDEKHVPPIYDHGQFVKFDDGIGYVRYHPGYDGINLMVMFTETLLSLPETSTE